LNILFRDIDRDPIMQKSYQDTLQNIIAMEATISFDLGDMENLKAALNSYCVDVQVSSIVLEILKSGLTIENIESLERNLNDLCAYFVGIGDFKALVNLYDQLGGFPLFRRIRIPAVPAWPNFFPPPNLLMNF
jgi:hypothetical protein